MLKQRVLLLFTLVGVVLMGGAIGAVYLIQFSLPSPEAPKDIRMGPLRTVSPVLQNEGRPSDLQPSEEGGFEARELDWKEPEFQKLFGPVRVVALWSDDPPRSWLRVGSVCSFLYERYGKADGLTWIPGVAGIDFRNMHVCQLATQDGERLELYVFNLPTSRCRTSGLLFARVPWQFISEDNPLNPAMEQRKAQVFNLLGTVEIVPEASCRNTMKSLAWGAIVTPLALLFAVGVLFALLRLRLAPV